MSEFMHLTESRADANGNQKLYNTMVKKRQVSSVQQCMWSGKTSVNMQGSLYIIVEESYEEVLKMLGVLK